LWVKLAVESTLKAFGRTNKTLSLHALRSK
jgi:hypothetical protein